MLLEATHSSLCIQPLYKECSLLSSLAVCASFMCVYIYSYICYCHSSVHAILQAGTLETCIASVMRGCAWGDLSWHNA